MTTLTLPYPVPYCAQIASPALAELILTEQLPAEEDPRWAESGAETPAEYAYWTQRACGVACLKMCVDALGGTSRTLVEWARTGLAAGGYLVRGGEEIGWRHDSLAALCRREGLQAQAQPAALNDIPALIAEGKMVIASVSYQIGTLGPVTRRGGHLVVVVGAELDEAGQPAALLVNNPSGRHPHLRTGARIPLERFAQGYTGRVIAVWR